MANEKSLTQSDVERTVEEQKKFERGVTQYGTTTRDLINDIVGNDVPAFSKCVKNEQLSTRMTKFFTNTKVDVYMYQSKLCSVITMPGVNIMNNTLTMKINSILQHMPSVINPVVIAQLIEQLSSIWKVLRRPGGFSKLTFNPVTRKFDINVDHVTIYMSTTMLNLLDTDDEIVAMCLAEVSQNMTLGMSYMYGLTGVVGMFVTPILGTVSLAKALPFIFVKPAMVILTSITLLILSVWCCIYLLNKVNIRNDDIVVRMGYGKPLASAVHKVAAYQMDYGDAERARINKNYNQLDSVMHGWDSIGYKFSNMLAKLKIVPVQSREEREQMILDKASRYDTSDRNVDRSTPTESVYYTNESAIPRFCYE